MKKTFVVIAATIGTLLLLPGAASAQGGDCPPGSTNPEYCPTVPPARDDALSGARGAVDVLGRRGSLTRLCNGEAATITATPDSPGVYTITLTIVVNGQTIVVAKGTKTVTKAGRTRIQLRPTKAGKKYLCGRNAVRGIVKSKFKPRGKKAFTVRRVVRLRGEVKPRTNQGPFLPGPCPAVDGRGC